MVSTFIVCLLAMFSAGNGFVLSQQDQPLYYLTGLDGGVLTAHPETEDGHAHPTPGIIVNEQLVQGNPTQEWGLYETFNPGQQYIISQENSYNEIRIYHIHPGSFPVDNEWSIGETETEGVVYIYTTFILDDKKSCIINNGLNERISFGPCDLASGSGAHWKLVPVSKK